MPETKNNHTDCAEETRALTPKQRRAILTLIVIAGAALRLHKLAAQGLWYDEVSTLIAATVVDKFMVFLRPEMPLEPPLFPLLTRVWRAIIDGTTHLSPGSNAYDFALRLLPCIIGVVSIPLAFQTCRALLKDERVALLAAFLTAISPFQIFYAQELRGYTLHVVLGLGALFCFVRCLEGATRRYWIGLTALLALSIWNHFYSVWMLAAADLYFLATFKAHRELLRKWIVAHALVLLLSVPPLHAAFTLNRLIAEIPFQWIPPPGLKTGFITFKNFFAGYSPHPRAYWPLFLAAGAAFLGGLYALRKRPKCLWLVCVFSVAPIAGSALVWRVHRFSFYEHRLFILCGGVSAFVVAQGVFALRKAHWKALATGLLIALSVPCLADYYGSGFHPVPAHRLGVRHKVDARAAARYIARWRTKGDVVGHASHFTLVPFTYYLPDRGVSLCMDDAARQGFLASYPNEAMWEHFGIMPVRIETATRNAERVWYVESWWEPFDLHPSCIAMRDWLDKHFTKEGAVPFYGITLYRYAKRHPSPNPASE